MTGKQERHLFVVVIRLWLFLAAISVTLCLLFVGLGIVMRVPVLGLGVGVLGAWLYYKYREQGIGFIPSVFRRMFEFK